MKKLNFKTPAILMFFFGILFLLLYFFMPENLLKQNGKTFFLGFSIISLGFAVMFLALHFVKKLKANKNTTQHEVRPPQTFDLAMFKDKNFSDYDKFVDWWATYDEEQISKDNFLFGAYQLMWFDNEVCNGGFDQFFDFAENSGWDLTEIKNTFKNLLPSTPYNLFVKALNTHKKDENCEKFNDLYDYDEMAHVIIPGLATKVVNYYKTNILKNKQKK